MVCTCSPTGPSTWHVLPPTTPALAIGAPLLCRHRPGPPGTLHVLGPAGGVALPPGSAPTVDFGRAPHSVVRLGGSDPTVSRHQGVLVGGTRAREWRLRNTGRLPIRVPGAVEPLLTGHETVLGPGFHPVLVDSTTRSHVLEVLISVPEEDTDASAALARTADRPVRTLSERERLVLTALFAPYLRRDDEPRPVPAPAVAEELAEVTGEPWRARQVAAVTEEVRIRLHRQGVGGLVVSGGVAAETLRHRLYRALAVDSPTLTPRDLDLLDPLDETVVEAGPTTTPAP